MRRFLLASLAAAGLTGCEPGEGSSQDSRFAGLTYSREETAAPTPVNYKEEIVRDAVGTGVPASQEGLAQFSRSFFDGDSRSLPSLGVANTNPVDMVRRRVVVPLQKPKKKGLQVDDVPPPESLPEIELPEPQPGVGPKGGGEALLGFDAFQKAMADWTAPLLSRLGWGAAKRRGGPGTRHAPYRVTVHHTQSPEVTMSEAATIKRVRSVQHYHMVGRGKEGKDVWDDIGYHFLIDGQGRIVEARPVEILGAHAGGANEGNIGVALIGDFNKSKPTAEQVRSLERLAVYLAIKFRRDPSHRGFLQPHKHFNSTDCPGKNLVAILDSIRDDVDTQADQAIAKFGAGGFTPLVVADNDR